MARHRRSMVDAVGRSEPMIEWNWIVGGGCMFKSAVKIGELGSSVSILVGSRRKPAMEMRRGSA